MRLVRNTFILVFASLTSFATHAQSQSQRLAESFISRFVAKFEEFPTCWPTEEGCKWYFASFWPEVSQKTLTRQNVDPNKLPIVFFDDCRRWITLSSAGNVTYILTAYSKDAIASSHPDGNVAQIYKITTGLVPGEGLRIIAPVHGGEAWSTYDRTGSFKFLTKRDFISAGYYDLFQRLEALPSRTSEGQSRESTQITIRQAAKQQCEAQRQSCIAACPPYRTNANGNVYCESRCREIVCN